MPRPALPSLALVLPLLVACAACEADADGPAPLSEEAEAAKADPVGSLRRSIDALAARPEHGAETVRVQHVLVGVGGNPRLPQVTRSAEEAEALAADVRARALAGESFDELVREHGDDEYPADYTMAAEPGAGPPGSIPREGMVAGFGDVAWRLEVGEVGVAPYHPDRSPYGWHVVKRIE